MFLSRLKKTSSSLFKLCLAGGLITWLIRSGRVDFFALKSLVTPQNIFICFALIALNLSLASERWRCLLGTQTQKVTFFSTAKLTLIGQFFNFAMPGGVGGDVIKAFYFSKDYPGSKTIAITSVLIDRVLGLYAMVIFALVAMTYDLPHIEKIPTLHNLFFAVLALFLVFTLALSLLFSIQLYNTGKFHSFIKALPLSKKLLELYESFHLYGKEGRTVLKSILLSLVSQFIAVLFLFFVAQAVGFNNIPLQTFLIVAPIGFMATAVPISPAGVGVGQAAFYYLFNIYLGQEGDVGAITITALQVANFIFGLFGAYFYVSRKNQQTHPEL